MSSKINAGAGRYCLLFTCVCLGCPAKSVGPKLSVEDSGAYPYPPHWWEPIPEDGAASWEILPQAAGPGEVILSKRNELGLLSNFAETPFVFRGRSYQSLEGFWQMMKYPEDASDPRATFPGIEWRHSREEVARMVGFEAKAAGDLGSESMRMMGINWVTFEGRRMQYRTQKRRAHYHVIVQATWAKIVQNPRVRQILLSTGDLVLRPDHRRPPDTPPAWRYDEILMSIRDAPEMSGEPKTGSRWSDRMSGARARSCRSHLWSPGARLGRTQSVKCERTATGKTSRAADLRHVRWPCGDVGWTAVRGRPE